jgi:hypothetical protein
MEEVMVANRASLVSDQRLASPTGGPPVRAHPSPPPEYASLR